MSELHRLPEAFSAAQRAHQLLPKDSSTDALCKEIRTKLRAKAAAAKVASCFCKRARGWVCCPRVKGGLHKREQGREWGEIVVREWGEIVARARFLKGEESHGRRSWVSGGGAVVRAASALVQNQGLLLVVVVCCGGKASLPPPAPSHPLTPAPISPLTAPLRDNDRAGTHAQVEKAADVDELD